MAKITTPDSLYGNSRDILREAERENEILADIAGEEYESPGDIPKGKYVIEKRLLDAAQKKNELLESIAEGGGGGGGGAAKAIGIDYATDVISLKNKDGETITGSGATLPAYGVSFDPTTGGLTLTKNGTAVQGQTVTIPNYGSPVGVTDSADMVDEGTIYLYEGTTGGVFTNGHFYYYDGFAWADGGEYAAATVQTDKTLLVEDRAADAKATGEAVGELKTQIRDISGQVIERGSWTYGGFQENGYTAISSAKYVFSKKLTAGEYTITAINSAYEFTIYYYVSDASGTLVRGYANGSYTFTAVGTFIITVRKHSKETITTEEFATLDDVISITAINDNAEIPEIKADIDVISPTYTTNPYAYAYEDGSELTAPRYIHTSPIAVAPGDTVTAKVNGYSSAVAIICTCSSTGTSISPKVKSKGNSEQTYTYRANENGYVTISYTQANGAEIKIYGEKSNASLFESIEIVNDAIGYESVNNYDPTVSQSGKYVDNNGTVQSNQYWTIYGPIQLEAGDTIIFTSKGVADAVSVLAGTDENETYYTPLIISTDGNEHDDFLYIPTEDMYVVISSQTVADVKYRIEKSDITKLQSNLDALSSKTEVCAFASIGVIGDSLASGCTNYVDPQTGNVTGKDRKSYSWGKFMEREHGVEVTLFTDGGANAFTWLTGQFGLSALQSADVMDAYIIGLGVNDYSKQGSNLGSSADIVTSEQSIPGSYDSFYGLYSNIIAKIKVKAPNSKIICLTMSSWHANKTTPKAFNQAIRDIVTAYSSIGNVYLIDLENDDYFKSSVFNRFWYYAHSTAPGYKSISDHLWTRLNALINENPNDFKDIQWIVHPETDPDD